MNEIKRKSILDDIYINNCRYCQPLKNICDIKKYGTLTVAKKMSSNDYLFKQFYAKLIKEKTCHSPRKDMRK